MSLKKYLIAGINPSKRPLTHYKEQGQEYSHSPTAKGPIAALGFYSSVSEHPLNIYTASHKLKSHEYNSLKIGNTSQSIFQCKIIGDNSSVSFSPILNGIPRITRSDCHPIGLESTSHYNRNLTTVPSPQIHSNKECIPVISYTQKLSNVNMMPKNHEPKKLQIDTTTVPSPQIHTNKECIPVSYTQKLSNVDMMRKSHECKKLIDNIDQSIYCDNSSMKFSSFPNEISGNDLIKPVAFTVMFSISVICIFVQVLLVLPKYITDHVGGQYAEDRVLGQHNPLRVLGAHFGQNYADRVMGNFRNRRYSRRG